MYKKLHLHILFVLLTAIAVFSFVGCSNSSHKTAIENERKNIIKAEITNKRKDAVSIPIVQSVELFTFKAQPIYLLGKSFMESPKPGNSNSQINTMFDGFGNKTELRCLDNDPVLKCITLKTSVGGQKQAIVFGKHGEIKRLPDELSDKAMIADSSYIASIAGIYEIPEEIPATPESNPNKEAESFNNPVSTPVSTPEIMINESDVQITQPKEAQELKLSDTKKNSSPKNKIDGSWLNNYPPNKKAAQ